MVRYYIIFTGQVQGVGFRWTYQRIAQKYDLTGWIRNMYNGNVECEVQGDGNLIMNSIGEMFSSSRWIQIDDYAIKEIPVKTNETSFDVVF